jgi:P-type Ca2+ transporter type 2C
MFEKIHKEDLQAVFKKLQTSEKGLTEKEIDERKKIYGLNELPEEEKVSIFKMFWKQVNSPLIYVLLFTAFFSFLIDHKIDTIIILTVIVLNLAIGIYHEIKAQKIIRGLKTLADPLCVVRREGEVKKIAVKDLVPGDVVILKDGDKVPADIRITKAFNVSAIESSLTGESVPVAKKNVVLPEKTQIADRINILFKGTIISTGEAEGIVFKTGIETEMGSIATTLTGIEQEKTLFAKRTGRLTKIMAIVATSAALLTFLIGLLRGLDFEEIILFTVASFISGIPEGLPAVLTVALSVAAYRLASRKGVVRSLSSVETLSSVTTIITDKTGTLTQNSMTITKLFLGDKRKFTVTGKTWEPKGDILFKNEKIDAQKDSYFKFVIPFIGIINKVELKEEEGRYEILGDPTEASRLVLAEKSGYKKQDLLEKYKIFDDMPFDQETKYRGMILQDNKSKERYAVIVGGAENVLEKCQSTMISHKKIKDISPYKSEYQDTISGWTKDAMRVQAIAYQKISDKEASFTQLDMNDFTFLGLMGINDPIRDNVPEAIEKAQKAGIRVIMATGDNKETAIAIGKQVGIKKPEKGYPYALEEIELEKLTEEEFKDMVLNVPIFARVVPKTKYKIAKILQKEKEIIAMTGDGVNDALALKKANIGIAMGVIGTDAAREASDLIIMDDNFATIVNAIEEGLTVFRNLRQTTLYLLSTNLAEDLFIIISLIIGVPLPLLPIHILWLNLLTDGLLDMALATEDSHDDTWEVGIRDKDEQIIGKKQFATLSVTILTIAMVGLLTFLYFLPEGIDKARTATFVMLTCSQIFFIFSMRSPTISILKLGIFTNKFLFVSIFIVVVLTIMLIEVPFLTDIFRFTTLKWSELGILLIFSTIPLIVMEMYKALKRHGYIPKY